MSRTRAAINAVLLPLGFCVGRIISVDGKTTNLPPRIRAYRVLPLRRA
jgi:hypothetical protein